MVKCENKINKLLLATEEKIFEKLVKKDHSFRKLTFGNRPNYFFIKFCFLNFRRFY